MNRISSLLPPPPAPPKIYKLVNIQTSEHRIENAMKIAKAMNMHPRACDYVRQRTGYRIIGKVAIN